MNDKQITNQQFTIGDLFETEDECGHILNVIISIEHTGLEDDIAILVLSNAGIREFFLEKEDYLTQAEAELYVSSRA